MLRSGSMIINKVKSNLSRSSSGRLTRDQSKSKLGKKSSTVYRLYFDVHYVEELKFTGDIVVSLDKVLGEKPFSTVSKIDASGRAMFRNERLAADIELTGSRPSRQQGEFKQKLVKILLMAGGNVASTTYFNATLYIGKRAPGEKVKFQLESGSFVVATVFMQLREDVQSLSNSPTSIMDDNKNNSGVFDEDKDKDGKQQRSGVLKRMTKGVGSIRGIGKKKTNANGGEKNDMKMALEELQLENNRLRKLINSTKQNATEMERLHKLNDDLEAEINDLKSNGVETEEYLKATKELCDIREAKAQLVMSLDELKHQIRGLSETVGDKRGKGSSRKKH